MDRGRQGRLRHRAGHPQQGLAHARRRRADRGLLPRHRHAGAARPAVRRLRRQDVRRARAGEREPRDLARRQALADLPPGQHDAALQDRQDLRHRPVAQRAGRRRQVHLAHRQEARALRARRPGALQRRRRRQQPQRRPRARRPRRQGGVGARRLTRVHAHLERLPRHERRLDRPALRLPHGLGVQLGAERQRRADRAHRARRRQAQADDAGARLRRQRSRRARHRPRRAQARLRPRRGPLRGRLAPLPRLAEGAPAVGALARDHLRRVGDDARRPRGQDLRRRLRRLAEHALGLGPGALEPERRLPQGLVARPLPSRHRAARGGRPRGREPLGRLPVHAPAEARRLLPAELEPRRDREVDEPAARRGRVPDRARLAARPPRRRHLRARQGAQSAASSRRGRRRRRSAGRTRAAGRPPRSRPRSPGS